MNAELVTDDEDPIRSNLTELVKPLVDPAIDETDDDDAEEGMLDEQPDDLASDESRHDRESYWGG